MIITCVARSHFVFASENKPVKSVQFEKLRSILSGSSLKTEGPYSDRCDSVSSLVSQVRLRMGHSGQKSPIDATIATIRPQNRDVPDRSWLDIPFVDGQSKDDVDYDSAGGIMHTPMTDAGSKKVRIADPESLMLLGVAVLRRLGVPSFPAYQHLDYGSPRLREIAKLAEAEGEKVKLFPISGILTLEGEPGFITFTPPHKRDFPAHAEIAALEVLDDAAMEAYMRIKMAQNLAWSLLRSFSEPPFYPDCGESRVRYIGHTLHNGMSAWSEKDARRGIFEAASTIDRPVNGAVSVRTMAEKNVVQTLISQIGLISMGTNALAPEPSKKRLKELVKAGLGYDVARCEELIASLEPAMERLMSFLKLAGKIKDHIHPAEGCEAMHNGGSN